MKLVLSAVGLVLLAGCSSLPGGKDADEHAAHHPTRAAATPAPTGYDQQVKMMQEMHQKMAAAKTPEERAALMKDHTKTMQDGMGMMGQMGEGMMSGKGMESGRGAMDPEMMKRRMDMMEVMMQMMMDREGMKPPASK